MSAIASAASSFVYNNANYYIGNTILLRDKNGVLTYFEVCSIFTRNGACFVVLRDSHLRDNGMAIRTRCIKDLCKCQSRQEIKDMILTGYLWVAFFKIKKSMSYPDPQLDFEDIEFGSAMIMEDILSSSSYAANKVNFLSSFLIDNSLSTKSSGYISSFDEDSASDICDKFVSPVIKCTCGAKKAMGIGDYQVGHSFYCDVHFSKKHSKL
jgi:hypothetical protein